MSNLYMSKIGSLGYGFIPAEYLPKNENEYYLRNLQNERTTVYRNLTAFEIERLVRNNNTSDDWNQLLVSEDFDPGLVKSCEFYGLVRIGKLQPWYLEYHDMRLPVGLRNSCIISSDLGDNVVVENVNYLSHYIIGNESILLNINELNNSSHAKFGNGFLKDGEPEEVRVWLEVCNENGGRKILPFDGMLPGDAMLWSRFRSDESFQERLIQLTGNKFDARRGYYGMIGERVVIKNCKIIKDVKIGPHAYIKGANKLKNLTINSSAEAVTQIGEGCELVNGILGYGSKAFYGVKAVRFFLGNNSQLKYGARLINSYLGDNSTISCCEVLNSLIFPAHEQHHNNSFLIAALIQGQSNIAAGATLGSNHNSRGADGELITGRGFWPGLCTSIKHNSYFANFTLLAKNDYSYELNIRLPFSLVSIDHDHNELTIMPAYWFFYDMYALARNAFKFGDRDKRPDKTQHIEYDYLAPDTINETFEALRLMETWAAENYLESKNEKPEPGMDVQEMGMRLLKETPEVFNSIKFIAHGVENSKRTTLITKAVAGYKMYQEIIRFYGISQLIFFIEHYGIKTINELRKKLLLVPKRSKWTNLGGQLVEENDLANLVNGIKAGELKNWNEVHQYYVKLGNEYPLSKCLHGLASLIEINGKGLDRVKADELESMFEFAIKFRKELSDNTFISREKDYNNAFRRMVYESDEEMECIIGRMDDNSFIKKEHSETQAFTSKVENLLKILKPQKRVSDGNGD